MSHLRPLCAHALDDLEQVTQPACESAALVTSPRAGEETSPRQRGLMALGSLRGGEWMDEWMNGQTRQMDRVEK